MTREALAEKLGFLTENQLAELIEVQVSTLSDWRRRSKGPVYVHFGNSYFYQMTDVADYMMSIKKERCRQHLISAI